MNVFFKIIFFCFIILCKPAFSLENCIHDTRNVLGQGDELRLSGHYFLAIQKYSLVESFSCSSQEIALAKLGYAQSLYQLYENTLAGDVLEGLNRLAVDEKIKNKGNLLKAWYQVEFRQKLNPMQRLQFVEYEAAADRIRKYDRLKNPWLAGSLSTVIPGAGQVYNGNYQSAAFSFIMNALLLMTALELEKNGHAISALTAGVFFSITYTGNILGSIQSAQTINQNHLRPSLEEQRKRSIPELEL